VALVGESADIGVTYRDPDSVPLPDGSALAVADAIARLAYQSAPLSADISVVT
jgi:hypothetical protein